MTLKSVMGGILAVALIAGTLAFILGLIIKKVSMGNRPYREEQYEFAVVT